MRWKTPPPPVFAAATGATGADATSGAGAGGGAGATAAGGDTGAGGAERAGAGFSPLYVSGTVTWAWVSPDGASGTLRGAGGAASPSLSAMGKAVSAGVDEGPPTGCPGAAGLADVVPVLATEMDGVVGHPQGSGS